MHEVVLTRRSVLGGALGFGTTAALAACGVGTDARSAPVPVAATPPPSPTRSSGATSTFGLTAAPVEVDLGGTVGTERSGSGGS